MGIFDVTSLARDALNNDPGGLRKQLGVTGRFPKIELFVTPLDGSLPFRLDRFTGYDFNSSMLVPVDSFSFSLVAPDDPRSPVATVREGDIVTLFANNVQIGTGIIDVTDVQSELNNGEIVNLTGRDLMSQYEDNSCVSIDSDPLWAGAYTISQVLNELNKNTRITKFITQDAPKAAYLFATEPSDSKLSALIRYLDGINCLAWMLPNGTICVGRPNMAQAPKGTLYLNKEQRRSNIISIKVTRETTQIPNIVVPIWSGQETVQSRVGKEQAIYNPNPDSVRIRKYGHRTIKSVVVSTPQGSDPQDLSGVNTIKYAGQNLLQSYAKREIARANTRALNVEIIIPGHYNEQGEPFEVDTVYKIQYDRGNIDENMYLYSVSHKLDAEGQKSVLNFCRLGTIVSDVVAP